MELLLITIHDNPLEKHLSDVPIYKTFVWIIGLPLRKTDCFTVKPQKAIPQNPLNRGHHLIPVFLIAGTV